MKKIFTFAAFAFVAVNGLPVPHAYALSDNSENTISWSDIRSGVYYNEDEFQGFLKKNSLTPVLKGNYDPLSSFVRDSSQTSLLLYLNTKTSEWALVKKTKYTPKPFHRDGYEQKDNAYYHFNAYGQMFFQSSFEQHGQNVTNRHDECGNVKNYIGFHENTNLIWQGLRDSDGKMIYIFTGDGDFIEKVTDGYVAVKSPTGRCHLANKISDFSFTLPSGPVPTSN